MNLGVNLYRARQIRKGARANIHQKRRRSDAIIKEPAVAVAAIVVPSRVVRSADLSFVFMPTRQPAPHTHSSISAEPGISIAATDDDKDVPGHETHPPHPASPSRSLPSRAPRDSGASERNEEKFSSPLARPFPLIGAPPSSRASSTSSADTLWRRTRPPPAGSSLLCPSFPLYLKGKKKSLIGIARRGRRPRLDPGPPAFLPPRPPPLIFLLRPTFHDKWPCQYVDRREERPAPRERWTLHQGRIARGGEAWLKATV